MWSDEVKFDCIVGRGVSPGPTNGSLECRFSSNFLKKHRLSDHTVWAITIYVDLEHGDEP